MNRVRSLSDALLKCDGDHFVNVVGAKRVVELLLRWLAQDALRSLVGVEDLEGCSIAHPHSAGTTHIDVDSQSTTSARGIDLHKQGGELWTGVKTAGVVTCLSSAQS